MRSSEPKPHWINKLLVRKSLHVCVGVPLGLMPRPVGGKPVRENIAPFAI